MCIRDRLWSWLRTAPRGGPDVSAGTVAPAPPASPLLPPPPSWRAAGSRAGSTRATVGTPSPGR
eukprot:294043-Lingulodinium_polyedra.AAC.1